MAGRSLLIHPPSFIAHHLLPPLGEPTGEAFSYTRGRFAPPIFLGCAAEKGRSLRVHSSSFIAHNLPPKASPEGAKPSHTPAVVLRPPIFAGWTLKADNLS